MKIVLVVGLILIAGILGGVLYLGAKLAALFGGGEFQGNLEDVGRSVALPMMDDQWLGERTHPKVPSDPRRG